MSLRLRLTLLYSTFMGGILLIFGAAVYILVNVILLNQVDNMLANVARGITDVTKVNSVGELVSLPSLDMTANAYVQLWGSDGNIIATSSSSGILTKALDPVGLEAGVAIYKDSYLDGAHLRVLSVPLFAGERSVGTLQVGSSLNVVDATQGKLISVMAFMAVFAVLMAGFGSWVVLGRALSPLEAITETVDQINRADDLSRRIPYKNQTDDEIGDLVVSFNQTLERLE
jgi:methyl-accepting chemotaxis protein